MKFVKVLCPSETRSNPTPSVKSFAFTLGELDLSKEVLGVISASICPELLILEFAGVPRVVNVS